MKRATGQRVTTAESSGFTLVEVLVTLTVFSLAMAVLVSSLYAGARAWRAVKRHQDLAASVERALRTMEDDIRHVFVMSEEEPAILEESDVLGGDSLRLTTLTSTKGHQAGVFGVWRKVTYKIEQSSNADSPTLVRLVESYVSGNPAPLITEVVKDDVRGLRFDYLQNDDFVPQWTVAGKLPPAVRVNIELSSGHNIVKVFQCPLGQFGSVRQ